VSAGEEKHVTWDRSHPLHDPVRARSDIGRALPFGAAVPEQIPVRPLGVDLHAPPTLVLSVVPFQEIGVELGHATVAGQLAGAGSSLERAGEDPGERPPPEPRSQAARLSLAVRSQREIGAARVLTGEAPGRLAVTGQMEDRKRGRRWQRT